MAIRQIDPHDCLYHSRRGRCTRCKRRVTLAELRAANRGLRRLLKMLKGVR